MAARRLQKLRGEDLPTIATSSDDSDTEDAPRSQQPFNAFDLLAGRPSGLTEDDQQEDEPEASAEASDSVNDRQLSAEASPQSKPLPSQARGKKKKKGKKNQHSTSERDKSGAAASTTAEASEDDIDAALRELALQDGQPQIADPTLAGLLAGRSGGAQAEADYSNPLDVDARKLKPDGELKRIFGAQTVKEVMRDHDQSLPGLDQAPRRIRRLAARGQIRPHAMRPGVLITPKPYWPAYNSTLVMEESDYVPPSADGEHWLQPEGYRMRYYHDIHYQVAQESFRRAQATYDPNNILAHLQVYPYHAEALLAMAELERGLAHNEQAEDYLERAVYALEMAWPSRVNPALVHVSMSWNEEVNKPLFRALFLYAQSLGRRGLHATALEVCKLLLNLDWRDPMGAVFIINYFAIRAHDYTFVKRYARKKANSPLDLVIPGFAYSYALALFLNHKKASTQQSSKHKAGSSSRGASPSQPQDDAEDNGETAHEQLVRAALLYPLVLAQLIPRLQDQGVAKDGQWAAIMQRKLFAQASDEGSGSLGHLTALYVERHHSLWKVPEVLAWLKQAADEASSMDDEATDPTLDYTITRNNAADGTSTAAGSSADAQQPLQMATLRRLLHPPGDNIYSHLHLHDFSDVVQRLPEEELQQLMGAGPRMQVQEDAEERVNAIAAEVIERIRRDHPNGDIDPELIREVIQAAQLAEGGEWPPPGQQGGEAAAAAAPDQPGNVPAAAAAAPAAPPAAPAAAQRQQPPAQPAQPRPNIFPAVQQMPEEQLRAVHPIVAMLRTLLPWTDAGQQPDYGNDAMVDDDEDEYETDNGTEPDDQQSAT
ncbi:hypothetical protein WJX73_003923 [Symbiochloris irregularis]|uniref:Transcription factor 25 n=1 Tax=Symbiochloris irregularis TaxID=706552 RepID=A0AAW1P413_9CHLO